MVKLGKLTDYAVVTLVHMHMHKGTLMSASYLSELTQFPQPTMSKILKILGGAKLITSSRGKDGGYQLDHEDISLKEIIEAMEGPIAITSCAEEGHECSMSNICVSKGRWSPVNEAIKIALEEVKLSDMVASQFRLNKNKNTEAAA